jgi:hypothetical protein
MSNTGTTCTAFNGTKLVASGFLPDVARKAKELIDGDKHAQVLIFDDLNGELIDVNFRGTPAQVVQRIAKHEKEDEAAGRVDGSTASPLQEPRRPGRPKLGVVAREVTLLPRHWDWLATQPGGASVALRKLVEHAAHTSRDKDRIRVAQEATYRFLSAMAGNEPGFEEAIRALFGGQAKRFHEQMQSWPADIRTHAKRISAAAFPHRAAESKDGGEL